MTLLQMSFSGAILIIAILFIRTLTIHRLPKQTFLVLWGLVLLRLLVPYTIPSPLSIYSVFCRYAPEDILTGLPSGIILAETSAEGPSQSMTQSDLSLPGRIQADFPVPPAAHSAIQINQESPEDTAQENAYSRSLSSSAAFTIWCVGTALFAAFFLFSYLRCYREFGASLPVTETYVNLWLACLPTRRPISVRQSDRINTPLTYGAFRPVILLPRQTDWTDTFQLQYILSHEYVHIRRFDTVTKLFAVLALCLHWFNPLVWLMYLLFNRDLELSCDEKVIRHFGESSRRAYAHMLIDMEAKKSGLMPLCNNFSKNAIEERITAIMKLRKTTRPAMLLAAGLIIGTAVLFTTSTTYTSAAGRADNPSAARQENARYRPDTSFTETEYAALLALRFDGYENMTVSEYQNRVWSLTDTAEYRDLLERFAQSELLLALRYADETASFFFNIYEPLTAEKWQTRAFGGYTATRFSGADDNASLEYNLFLTITDPDRLTVGQYDAARQGMMSGLELLLQDRTVEQLQDTPYMREEILAGIDSLKQKWGSGYLAIEVEYLFQPLTPDFTPDESDTASASTVESGPSPEETHPRINDYATEADYRSLLTLMIQDYDKLSTVAFNNTLLDWANQHYDSYERIREDVSRDDFQVDLTTEELSFARLTMELSGEENYRWVQHLKTGRPEEDPVYCSPRFQKEAADGLLWCGFDYALSYHIADADRLTVGERDKAVGSALDAIQEFWNETSLEELQKLTRDDVLNKLEEIAARFSDRSIRITILKDQLYFEHMDERAYVMF